MYSTAKSQRAHQVSLALGEKGHANGIPRLLFLVLEGSQLRRHFAPESPSIRFRGTTACTNAETRKGDAKARKSGMPYAVLLGSAFILLYNHLSPLPTFLRISQSAIVTENVKPKLSIRGKFQPVARYAA